MVRSIFVVLLLVIPGVLTSCSETSMKVTDPTCEYLQNPLVINTPVPMLGWKLSAEENGKRQTAYRVLAASDEKKLQFDEGDLWDSGIVPGSQSQHIRYGGAPLTSRQKVYWKVMVWDEQNQPSEWSSMSRFSMGLLQPSDWSAQWIGKAEDASPDSTQTPPAPYFRHNFEINKAIRHARVYVTGLGFYELFFNGQRIGTQQLAPALTNYDRRPLKKLIYFYDDQSTQRVLYNCFEVTDQLRAGTNAVGMVLGNGWYNQRDRTVEGCMWYDTPRMILQLEIEFTDGTTQTVCSNDTWKVSTGPLLHDGIFTGEVYDARKELTGWNTPTYVDSDWQQAQRVRSPLGTLEAQTAPFDEVVRELQPQSVGQINDSTQRYRLPEMIAGWLQLTVKGESGDSIRLRFIGEEGRDFGQTDLYILKGGEAETWQPRFTWHAFREFEVISRRVKTDEKSFVAKSVHTNPASAGSFTSSNELFDKINEVYRRTQEANFHGSISSDCPHRERLAYTGDAQVAVDAALYSYDMTQFYRKWLNDMEDARNHQTGYVPHTAPFGGGGGGPAWGSAMVIMPWSYYQFYGDVSLLRLHYKAMSQWVNYLATRTDERGIVVREEPNGWCLGDWCTPTKIELPEPLVNTAYYYHVADLMARVASVLGERNDEQQFKLLATTIKKHFNDVFYNAETGHYWEGRQGADVLPLAFGMVPEENRAKVFNALLDHLDKLDYHFDTGILATPLLLKVLTDEGRADLAYKVMNQRTEPSYGYVLDSDYSGMWEDWHGRSSRNHPMFGSVVAWFYGTLGGIRPDPDMPGMQQFVVAPQFVDGLDRFDASYRSLYGSIRSVWERKPDGTVSVTLQIPANCSARICLPSNWTWLTGGTAGQTLSSGNHLLTARKTNESER